MVFLVGPTTAPPIPDFVAWTASQHTFIDYLGEEWDLSFGLSGLKLMAGVRGLRAAPVQQYFTKPAAVAGQIWRGSNTDPRDVFWPLKVFNNVGSQEWIDHNARFWKTMDPDETGTWIVTQPSGARRSLQVRYMGLAEDSDDFDPGLIGWCTYGIQLVAEQPYWLGDPVLREFTNAASQDFFGGSDGGGLAPPFFISAGSTTSSASIGNPGDVPAWPVWTVKGPTTSVTVGLGGHRIGFPMTIAAGDWVRINTDPTDQVAYDQDGVDRSAQLTLVDFAPIPKGADVPLSITMVGTGSVQVQITPGYRWAK